MQLLAGSFCCSYQQHPTHRPNILNIAKATCSVLSLKYFMQWLTYLLDVAAVKSVSSGIA